MKKAVSLLLLMFLLLSTSNVSAQQKKKAPASSKQYITISFPYNPGAMRKVPIYSDIRGMQKKLARYISVMGVYTVQPIPDSKQYFKGGFYKLINSSGSRSARLNLSESVAHPRTSAINSVRLSTH